GAAPRRGARRDRPSSTCGAQSKRTSATASWPATTRTSTPSATARNSRTCSRPDAGTPLYTRGVKKGPPSKKRRPAAARAARPSVILLATGAGMNLRSSRPGVLHRVGGRTLLEASLETCAALSPARTVVVIGPARREIEDLLAGRPVTLLVQDPPAGTADAARRAIGVLPRSTSAVLVLRADVPLLRAETVRGLVRRQREG